MDPASLPRPSTQDSRCHAAISSAAAAQHGGFHPTLAQAREALEITRGDALLEQVKTVLANPSPP
jgi:hypothetical protein